MCTICKIVLTNRTVRRVVDKSSAGSTWSDLGYVRLSILGDASLLSIYRTSQNASTANRPHCFMALGSQARALAKRRHVSTILCADCSGD